MSETIGSKKQNSACHFCDHAARRSGRHKIAEQVACSIENCRKVFCSRRACMAKLRGPGVPQTIDEFRQWKNVIESGHVFFICPHCVDQAECQGPQCKKRGHVKQQHPSPEASQETMPMTSPIAAMPQKRTYMPLPTMAAVEAGVIEVAAPPIVAVTIPSYEELGNLISYETSIQQMMGTAPFDFHRKRRKSASFEVIAPIPIRVSPLAGQLGGLKIG